MVLGYGGMEFLMSLLCLNFFDAIHWADSNAKTTECATPIINTVIFSIRNDGMFWAYEIAAVARNANCRDF